MEIREFITVADATIERLVPRIDVGRAQSIRRSASAGSWEVAIPELVAVLEHDQVAVSSEDQDVLRRLLERLGEPTEDIDRLNVASGER